MKPADTEARVKYLVAELDIDTLLSKLHEYELAGQRTQSMSDGRGSGESPLPIAETDNGHVLGPADPLDRDIRTDRAFIEVGLGHLLAAAVPLLTIQRKYLNARTTDLDKATTLAKPPPGSGPCGNTWCDHTCSGKGNDRLRKSKRKGDDAAKAPIARCHNCDVYYLRNGVERPRQMCHAEKANGWA